MVERRYYWNKKITEEDLHMTIFNLLNNFEYKKKGNKFDEINEYKESIILSYIFDINNEDSIKYILDKKLLEKLEKKTINLIKIIKYQYLSYNEENKDKYDRIS